MPSSRRRSKARPPSRFQPPRTSSPDRTATPAPGASSDAAASAAPGPNASPAASSPTSAGRPRDASGRDAANRDAASRRAAERARQRGTRRSRQPTRRSFLERNRTRILWLVVAVAVIAFGAYAYVVTTAPAYACGSEWTAPSAAPSASLAPSQTPQIGYAQPDMGRTHVTPGAQVRYLYCPPASGNHYIGTGIGPIQPKLYGPNDHPAPEGWVHNLEHGALVVLYKCPSDACTDAGQAQLSQFFQSFPNSPVCGVPPGVVGPVIAQFNDMAYPVVALTWDHILPLQSFDAAQILAFYNQTGERFNPEPQCSGASPSPGASASPAAS